MVVGNRLAIQPYQRIDWTWPVALAALAKDGTLDRRQLLDGAVGALLRGGTPVVLRGYREVYQAMAVDIPVAEIPTRDLARLLPDTASAVAGLALAELQRAQAAGHLTTAAAVTAARDLLGRTEKKLVTAGLSWLDQLGSDGRRDRASGDSRVWTLRSGHPAPRGDVGAQAGRAGAAGPGDPGGGRRGRGGPPGRPAGAAGGRARDVDART
jgi:hypothetical protein